jgi:hypothetical protein
MGSRRDGIRKLFEEARAPYLENEESIVAEGLAMSGPHPWLASAVILIARVFGRSQLYYVTVTGRRVLFMKATLIGRPKGFAWADARATVAISDVTPGRMWSHLNYQRPGAKRLRLNFGPMWRADMDAIVAALRRR